MEYNNQIDEIIARFLAGESSIEDNNYLSQRIAEEPEFREYVLEMKNIWDASGDSVTNSSESDAQLIAMWNKIDTKDKRNKYQIFARWCRNAAAILALPLLILSCWLLLSRADSSFQPIDYQISALYGTRTKTVLPDSTVVWLNGGSTLRYWVVKGDPRRNIQLVGEGYFDVAKDKKHPFIVNANNVKVEALGTEFNVISYPSDSLICVTLVEGSVKVAMPDAESILNPNERIIYNQENGENQIFLGNTDKWCQWRDGKLIFRNEPLSKIYKRLGQIYNVNFQVDPKCQDMICHATFKDSSLDKMLELLKKVMPIDYEYFNDLNGDATNTRYIKVYPKE